MIIPQNEWTELLMKIAVALREGVIGGIGGAIGYFRILIKDEDARWQWGVALMYVSIGAFVAFAVGTFIPVATVGRDGIIGLVGVSSYKILELVEGRVIKMTTDKIVGGKDE